MKKGNMKKRGYKKSAKVSPYYIGIVSKKINKFCFVDPIKQEDKRKITSLEKLTKIIVKEKINIQNIKPLFESIYIPKQNMLTANNGDLVLIQIQEDNSGGDYIGNIVAIIDRKKEEIVGTMDIQKGIAFVIPEDKSFISDIFIPKQELFGAHTGDKVLVKITKYANRELTRKNSEGKVVKIVARAGDSHAKMKSILAENNISEEFPEEVIEEAKNIKTYIEDEELKGRKDLTDIFTITIDGEDAKDLDDAVAIEKKENYKVWISIADVSHYVKENTQIDKEAYKRGNSTYLIDTVIPMLPFELSNEICSLNAGEKRLALTVEAEIDKDGNIISYDIYKSVIKVDRRMSYNEVQDILDKKGNYEALKEEFSEKYGEKRLNDFSLFERLTNILKKRRMKNGYISFEVPEVEIILNDEGKTISVKDKERKFSYEIIEHLMLTANEITSKHFSSLEMPVLYRIHEYPLISKVELLNETLKEYGLCLNKFKKDKKDMIDDDDIWYVPQSEYIRVLKEIKKREEDAKLRKEEKEVLDIGYMSYLLLRSMRQARYSFKNFGHFGLASKYYSHFTSPIRRYSDLFFHRAISRYLEDNNYYSNTKKDLGYKKELEKIAEHISETERISQKVEREYDKIKVSEYVEEFRGHTFDGVVSGMIEKGIFVDIGREIEGLVLNSDILKAKNMKDKKDYKIGEKVKVIVKEVNVQNGEITLGLI